MHYAYKKKLFSNLILVSNAFTMKNFHQQHHHYEPTQLILALHGYYSDLSRILPILSSNCLHLWFDSPLVSFVAVVILYYLNLLYIPLILLQTFCSIRPSLLSCGGSWVVVLDCGGSSDSGNNISGTFDEEEGPDESRVNTPLDRDELGDMRRIV